MTLKIGIGDCFPIKAQIEFDNKLGRYSGVIISHANSHGCIVRGRMSIADSIIMFVEYEKITKVITNE